MRRREVLTTGITAAAALAQSAGAQTTPHKGRLKQSVTMGVFGLVLVGRALGSFALGGRLAAPVRV